jgi:hypothetical protein
MAKKDKVRYQKEMEDYTPSESSDDDDSDDSDDGKKKKTKPKAKKAKKDPNAPKRPMNTYMLYSNSVRAQVKEENPDLSMGDLVSYSIIAICSFSLQSYSLIHTHNLAVYVNAVERDFFAIQGTQRR